MSRWKLQFVDGARHDNLKLLKGLNAARTSGERKLKKVFLETSTTCLANCNHCYYRNNKNKTELEINEIYKIQDYLLTLGVEAITYAGADAIFRADHVEILKRGKSLGFIQNYCTRGFLSHINELKSIVDVEPVHIQFSTDPSLCNIALEDEISRISIINTLVRNTPIYISWVITVTQDILDFIFPLIDAIYESGGNEVRLHKIVSFGMPEEYKRQIPDTTQYISLLTQIINYFNKNFSTGAIVVEDTFSVFRKVIDGVDNLQLHIDNTGCPMGQTAVTISNDGGIYLCPMCKSEKMKIGSSWWNLKEIWQNFNITNPFSQEKFDGVTCSKCKVFSQCLGGCRCQAVAAEGNLWGKDPGCIY